MHDSSKNGGTTRRAFMAATAALGVAAATPAAADASSTRRHQKPAKGLRIDAHHHFVPPGYVERGGPLPVFRTWSVQRSLEDMDRAEVDASVLSVTTPVLQVLAEDGNMMSRQLIRRCNDFGAQLVADHPGRFGLFAAIPLTDVEGSLREIEYAFDTLKADGIGLFTSYGNQWLGNAAFDPVFAELNRRKAVVYTHPVAPPWGSAIPQVNIALIEYGTDTTRAIASMIFAGASQRYPDVKMIFSHGGGTIPFLVRRFIREAAGNPALATLLPGGFMPELNRFYFDVAQIPSRPALAALREIAPASRMLFGTDFPYLTAAEHVTGIEQSGLFDTWERRAIDANIASLLPRLAESVAR
ncbi:amidohydrolase family protein [Lentzea sp. BCCO 10_0061]|uniref:Amidohydrolase family protein n=1 Tax=Lentzea sokolovensis TaxID=3095429 RepID=A0ABU4UQ13_9PSEU|nr:amidohydrolase family protein [Lentzea sp. BCCO 10_0061]MDX8141375.1 amidohydrolase family protein [Lentzea sp. BCCO 10_0061]